MAHKCTLLTSHQQSTLHPISFTNFLLTLCSAQRSSTTGGDPGNKGYLPANVIKPLYHYDFDYHCCSWGEQHMIMNNWNLPLCCSMDKISNPNYPTYPVGTCCLSYVKITSAFPMPRSSLLWWILGKNLSPHDLYIPCDALFKNYITMNQYGLI